MDGAAELFLSYKAEDRPRLAPLVQALRKAGFEVWWDQDIAGGSDWRSEIENHLENARCVLVAWSNSTIGPEGRFVRDEASLAQETGRYLPITIDKVRPPLGFRELQAISLVDWKGRATDPSFRALVRSIRARLGHDAPATDSPAPRTASGLSRRSALLAGGAAGVVALAGGSYWLFAAGSARATRIAVLPFANLSGDAAQDYFSDGLAEELRSNLSRAGLKVIGRTSSEEVARQDTRTIVDKLDVSHILTGSVRRSAERMRISAQLVDGSDGLETWAESYDRTPGDAIAIQSDIAEKVAVALSIALGVVHNAVELGGTTVAAAQDLFLQSQSLAIPSTTQGQLQRIDLLERAVRLDPKFARAWIQLGSAHVLLAGRYTSNPDDLGPILDKAETFIRRGIKLAPELGLGQSQLAFLASNRLQFGAALNGTRDALSANPNDVDVLQVAANDLPWIGDKSEWQAPVKRLIELEPLRPQAHAAMARGHLASGDYKSAVAEGLTAAKSASPFQSASIVACWGALADRQDELARSLANALPPDDMFGETFKLILLHRQNDLPAWTSRFDAVRASIGKVGSYQFAQVYAQANRLDEAFDALASAERIKDSGLIYAMRDPLLKPLRRDPRFLALLRRLQFPLIDPEISGS